MSWLECTWVNDFYLEGSIFVFFYSFKTFVKFQFNVNQLMGKLKMNSYVPYPPCSVSSDTAIGMLMHGCYDTSCIVCHIIAHRHSIEVR